MFIIANFREQSVVVGTSAHASSWRIYNAAGRHVFLTLVIYLFEIIHSKKGQKIELLLIFRTLECLNDKVKELSFIDSNFPLF